MSNQTNHIILPLDNMSNKESLNIMKKTQGKVWGYKVRRQILKEGLNFILEAKQYGNIMVDFKLFDIPSAMTESIELHYAYGADITTIHCSSQYKPDEWNIDSTKLAGVTILTSMNEIDFSKVYNQSRIINKVNDFAEFALHNKYGYIICSSKELSGLKNLKIRKICPGIRPKWYQNYKDENEDQVRTMTPFEAIINGADYLVIGRPILKSEDIVKAIELTNKEIKEAIDLNGL